MRVRLKKHASRVDEAIDLASYVMNDYNYELQKQRILEKYHFDVFDVEKMMDSRSKIARLFQRDFQTHHEVLNFFFAKRSNAFSLARFFLKTPYFQAEKEDVVLFFTKMKTALKVLWQPLKSLNS